MFVCLFIWFLFLLLNFHLFLFLPSFLSFACMFPIFIYLFLPFCLSSFFEPLFLPSFFLFPFSQVPHMILKSASISWESNEWMFEKRGGRPSIVSSRWRRWQGMRDSDNGRWMGLSKFLHFHDTPIWETIGKSVFMSFLSLKLLKWKVVNETVPFHHWLRAKATSRWLIKKD